MFVMKNRRMITALTGIILAACSSLAQQTESAITQGPIITPDTNEIVIQHGENYTLICKSQRNIEFKQQEQAEDMTLPFNIISRKTSSIDPEYPYVIEIDLLNVNEHAVGYFACFDDTINSNGVLRLNSLKSEPNNTEHITYIYVYVNGSENLFAPMNQVVTVNDDDKKIVIGCRPISPNITVEISAGEVIYETYNPKIGFTLRMDNFKTQKLSLLVCDYKMNYYPYLTSIQDVYIDKYVGRAEEPIIIGNSSKRYFLEGETFSLNCYVKYQINFATHLAWKLPNEYLWPSIINKTNEYKIDDKLYNNITITNATKDYEGEYLCISNDVKKKSVYVKYLAEPFLDLTSNNKVFFDKITHKTIKIQFTLTGYPKPKIIVYKNDEELTLLNSKYSIQPTAMNLFYFTIYNASVDDTGNYTITATNEILTKSLSFERRVSRPPSLSMESEDRTYVINSYVNNLMACNVSGYPLPKVEWHQTVTSYGSQQNYTFESHHEVYHSLYQLTSYMNLAKLNYSGDIICIATNEEGEASASTKVFLYEVERGFGIKDKENTWFIEGQDVVLTCVAAFSKYINVTWLNLTDSDKVAMSVSENEISNVAQVHISEIKKEQSGEYLCQGSTEYIFETDSILISVHEKNPVEILFPVENEEQLVYPFQNVSLVCRATGIPKPNINWYKDSVPVFDDHNGTYIQERDMGNTDVESKLFIVNINEDNGGKYECIADNSEGKVTSNSYQIYVNTKSTNGLAYLSIIAVIFIILLIVILYLMVKVRKEKMFRKELAKAGLLYFKEGVTKSLNPDLGVDEQADLLPYDQKFEFPPEKLLLGKQLGSGAFGVVYKAEARGIVNAEEDTIVAVKMVKKTADNMYIKALTSELKIMVHLGKHINIVNLLGACTKNVGKRELSVIVEYCKFGNIHDYVIKHREVYIDQLNENGEHTVGRVNRGFSCSSGNSGTHSSYFGSHCTQDTDHTFLNTGGTNRSGPRKDNGTQQVELGKVSESGYVQPLWSSNYESDYSYDGRAPRPLSSRDLLCWAFQIARGMEYLASRRVLHGDLAARNILLAEGNVVKICDFGLARSIYKNDEYQKQSNSPLPVKWLAIECITDRIFSTQSDVWSFGIVLWELFTLAKTPYPGINPNEILPWLASGKRLDKPRYADDRIYEVMKHCWETKPTARPTFTSLQETLGSFLEDNVRAHYVDLNLTCLTSNQACIESGREDYLAMMLAPDYNNHVKPSPHHYVNDTTSFFPPITPLQDEDGYLQMNTGNRVNMLNGQQVHVFDFDSRKSSSREASELTPMLTLNNLPARSGSESDHDGNSSPHLNICPPIEEETDDVFEVKLNMKNSNQRAVTNPTYIAFNDDLEKKPLTNNYANIGNGLVT